MAGKDGQAMEEGGAGPTPSTSQESLPQEAGPVAATPATLQAGDGSSNPRSNGSRSLQRSPGTTGNGALTRPAALAPLPPPPPQRVVEEEAYLDALDTIIRRDFYPHLGRLRRGVAHLRRSAFGLDGDRGSATAASAEGATPLPGGSVIGTPAAPAHTAPSPAWTSAAWTPTPGGPSGVASTPRPSNSTIATTAVAAPAGSDMAGAPLPTHLSLDAFQAAYTSEDNASFAGLLSKENTERKRKHSWAFAKEGGGPLLLTDGTDGAMGAMGQPKRIEGLSRGPGPALPAPETGTTQPPTQLVDRTMRSLLLFPPGAPRTMADLPVLQGKAKSIHHAGTRFSAAMLRAAALPTVEQEQSQPPSDSTPGGGSGRRGYDYVASTPLIRPHEDIDPSALMTWGEIEGTPVLLDRTGEGSVNLDRTPALPDEPYLEVEGVRSFRMPARPRRDVLGQQLAERAARSLRQRSDTFRTPIGGVPLSPALGVGTITPGGRTPGRARSANPSAAAAAGGRPLSAAALGLLQRTTGLTAAQSPRLLSLGGGVASGTPTPRRVPTGFTTPRGVGAMPSHPSSASRT